MKETNSGRRRPWQILFRALGREFEVNGNQYTLLVDETSLKDDTLEVQVISEGDKDAIIDLPRETFISANRIRVPKEALLS